MKVIIILAILIAAVYYISKKFIAPKNEELFKITEDEILEDIQTRPKMKAKPKKEKDPLTKESKAKIVKHITETGEYVAPVKPKRKYNKKPKL